jgi:hypothetical protein
MANPVQILAKIKRNLDAVGVPATLNSSSVVAAGMTISYVSASIQSPMGGVDGGSSPFLGMGVVAPGVIKIKGAAGENSIAAIFVAASDLAVLACCARFANDVSVEAGDTATELARLAGHPDLKMMGE